MPELVCSWLRNTLLETDILYNKWFMRYSNEFMLVVSIKKGSVKDAIL